LELLNKIINDQILSCEVLELKLLFKV